MLFSAFDQSLNICSVRTCVVGDCQSYHKINLGEVQPCSGKCSVCLTTQQLNITKQHSTLLNKCSVLFNEMFSTFDWGLIHDDTCMEWGNN